MPKELHTNTDHLRFLIDVSAEQLDLYVAIYDRDVIQYYFDRILYSIIINFCFNLRNELKYIFLLFPW